MTPLSALPPTSAPLPWQEASWSRLGHQLVEGQLPHAQLICGPQYTGKTRFAIALARLLLCASPRSGLNCGECHACELSASGNNGDFRWVEPAETSRVIKIDQIRELLDFANLTANFGVRKVVVIAPAETMNPNAANGLLKVLEEPPANTYFILLCHRLHGLPATIRSRTQLLRFAQPGREDCLAWLDPISGAREHSEQLLALAGDRPLLAADLHSDPAAERQVLVRQGIAALLAGSAPAAALATAVKDEEPERLVVYLLEAIQAALRSLQANQLRSPPARAAFQLRDELLALQRAISAGSNPNRQLLLETLMAKVQRVLGREGLGANIVANPTSAPL